MKSHYSPDSNNSQNVEDDISANKKTLDIYRREMLYALKLSFPYLYQIDLERAIEYSIKKRFKNTDVTMRNGKKIVLYLM